MSEPLRRSCAWCSPPGSPTYDPTASHGLCGKHARETLLITPLLGALATLRGPSFMGDDAKARCARLIDSVVSRLNREELLHIFASESPASSPDLPASMPVDDIRVAAPGDTSERTP